MDKEIYGRRRQRLDLEEYERLRKIGAISLDQRRSRPLWFDGRFLKAADLNQEQNYLLSRMADMTLAAGPGVVSGLSVTALSGGRLAIEKGYGTTFDGEAVELAHDLTVDLNNISLTRELQVQLGARKKIVPPLRQRSGLFVLALRPLEFTANPTVSYPTHIDESRSSEDGEIVEATAVTLIPFAPAVMGEDSQTRRARAAHRIFVRGERLHSPSYTLPLAMLELNRGNIRWVDSYMVRRDIRDSSPAALGDSSSQLRAAHFRQFREQLPLVAEQHPGPLAAADHFVSLPPVGLLPAASVDMAAEKQFFFPESMEVEISIIAEDELPALIGESLQLPAIDLTASADELAASPVMILVPVPRDMFFSKKNLLGSTSITIPRPIVPRVRTPRMMVNKIWDRHFRQSIAPSAKNALDTQARQSLLSDVRYLWYTRRRILNVNRENLGRVSAFAMESDTVVEESVTMRMEETGVAGRYKTIRERSTAKALGFYNDLAYSLRDSRIIVADLAEKTAEKEKLDTRKVMEIAADYQKERSGEGLKKLEEHLLENETKRDNTLNKSARKRNTDKIEAIVASGKAVELDRVLAEMEPEKVAEVAEKMNAIMKSESREEARKERIKALITGMGVRK